MSDLTPEAREELARLADDHEAMDHEPTADAIRDLLQALTQAEARTQAVRELLCASDDGTEYEHDHEDPTEGHDGCPAYWVHDIRRALDGTPPSA